MNTKTCTRCKGTGNTGHTYAGGTCRNCGGTGTVEMETAEAKAAREFINWADEQGARREKGARATWAAHAARHLKATAPDRFAKAIASRKAGRADDVYIALVALATEASKGN